MQGVEGRARSGKRRALGSNDIGTYPGQGGWLHTRYDERLWVIDGELTVWAGDERFTVGPGGFVTIPRNTAHVIRSGPQGARALNITSPAGFAELIERTGVPAELAGPDAQLDVARFLEVSTALGDVVLGPPGTTPDQLDPQHVGRLDDLHGCSPTPPAAR